MSYLIDQFTLVPKLKTRGSVPAAIMAEIADYFRHAFPLPKFPNTVTDA
jgi:hypothetical protein